MKKIYLTLNLRYDYIYEQGPNLFNSKVTFQKNKDYFYANVDIVSYLLLLASTFH